MRDPLKRIEFACYFSFFGGKASGGAPSRSSGHGDIRPSSGAEKAASKGFARWGAGALRKLAQRRLGGDHRRFMAALDRR
jgi:hypothetical protein